MRNKTDANPHIRIHKISRCGKIISTLDLPQDPDAIEYDQQPVFAENGDVYIWKRTPDTYSILKWQWVDVPADPQPGPDAPENLKIIPSLNGLYLTWGASPQDPGCVDHYEIERATSADGIYTPAATVDKGTLNFNDTTVLPGSTYYYKVRALADGLSSEFTAPISGTRE